MRDDTILENTIQIKIHPCPRTINKKLKNLFEWNIKTSSMGIFSLFSPRKLIVLALIAVSLLNVPTPVSAQVDQAAQATVTCSPGWFIDNGYCFPCYAGTYSPSGFCVNCPANTWSAAIAATSSSTCQPCPVNEVSPPGSGSEAACVVPYPY